MNAYWPTDTEILLAVGGWLVGVLVLGYWISSLRSVYVARPLAWLSIVGHTLMIERLVRNEPAGVRMLALIAVGLLSMKAVVAVEARLSSGLRFGPLRWALFAGAWFGMRPSVFRNVPGPPRDGAAKLIWSGIKRMVAGMALIGLAVWMTNGFDVSGDEPVRLIAASLLLLAGLSLLVHFGGLNVMAGALRRCGANCRPLFVAPLLSTSLTEFWGRRWNQAFSEMTSAAVFRPLRTKIGVAGATTSAFVFSGLLHELAISLPVKAGFGLPMAYFGLHAIAMRLESRWRTGGKPVDRVAWRGRLWTMAWLLIPLPILFHGPFMRGCVLPMIGLG